MTKSDFEQAVGTAFTTTIGERPIALELTDVRAIPASPRPGGGFSLLFRGPRDVALPQATYSLAGKGGAHDIFIVPVAADAAGRLYEAVFN
ncbi:hypothetical protein FKO01_50250 [Mesorhizobium sp. B2-3-3]|uniref:DUF6916 family protein n=1 Tax=unclassified Mesorhizobium TaxID=325217 RepID=UPI00112E039B|nr:MULTISPECIES: hypothetical protein [unclassified Mesorhizobium]TPK71806.1 hypothetical protein FJ930_14395 [Mesorhizobium sp. B2-4-15]TPM35379.1 hypothetical protein FJ958_05575 [Mesorhizobium sp. B2-3-5]TPN00873.1 hypothetical protein FKO01_50250 [Mesorhizobium sp. B2-3-3]